jgi:hypothetical protein
MGRVSMFFPADMVVVDTLACGRLRPRAASNDAAERVPTCRPSTLVDIGAAFPVASIGG